MGILILGIESSCDDTSAAVLEDTKILANIIAGQEVHKNFGGVVPELASRAHQQNIIPVIHQALKQAKIQKNQLDAVAFTRGPGLLGSLLVGTSFSKAFAMASGIPIIEVDHLKAHILAHFITDEPGQTVPEFPFICLTVSGGHTQIVRVDDPHSFTILGQTIDDAAGEAFDKAAKIMGMPYPGGPYIDKLAREGDPEKFSFPKPRIPGLDYSFSGLKTSFLYFIRDELKKDKDFIQKEQASLAASIQRIIIEVLMDKLEQAAEEAGISQIALAGGVSANSGLRKALVEKGTEKGWKIFIPKFQYTTDNAAMIAIAGYFKYLAKDFAPQDIAPYARSNF
ncbi:MAG: tRNA (adenosine(37)-N6)-threonylcarbamoyltransferase complex transferase subunit TsaD [Bacteroidales bacterium]|jgi:N6-L-threonylcarbamoyladenine synthase|nr:tRNA (adenosine(37)-N6)-threonylcarbamoyltransferase complex transferase subunit TsaD [Bacteroidales bacterium]